jgi:simple sugar transport system substrate-binding protein
MRALRVVMMCAVMAAAGIGAGCGESDTSGTSTAAPAASTSTPATTPGSGAAEKQVTVGLFLPSTTNEFWNSIKYGAEQEAKRLGNVKLIVQASTDDADLTAGISKVQNLLTQGAEAIVIVPLADTFKPVLQRTADAGTPVVCVNGCVTGWDGYTSFIQTDNTHAGELAGEFIDETLGGKGTVGMLQCYVGVPSCDQRIDGAKAKLPSGITVKGPLETKCLREKAVQGTQNLMTANPDMKLIYAVCGQAALTAEHVIEGTGKKILVIGVDGTRDEADAIKSGAQLATIAQAPVKMGELGVQQAVAKLRGEQVTKEISSGETLVTKDNVDQYLASLPPAGS